MLLTMTAGLPLAALLLAAGFMPIAKRIARRYGIVSVPYTESRHQRQTPLMGGAAIIAAILIMLGVSRMLPLWLMAGTVGLFAIGLIDDAIVLLRCGNFCFSWWWCR